MNGFLGNFGLPKVPQFPTFGFGGQGQAQPQQQPQPQGQGQTQPGFGPFRFPTFTNPFNAISGNNAPSESPASGSSGSSDSSTASTDPK